MSERIKIGVLGAMNTGKTTLVESFRNDPRIKTVRESARDYFTENPNADRASVFTMHELQGMIRSREAAIQDPDKIILTDRTIIDPVVYAMYFGHVDLTIALLDDMVSYVSSYTYFVLCSPEGILFKQEGVRGKEDVKMRDELHNEFTKFLDSNDLSYAVLTGGKEERKRGLQEIIDINRKRVFS